MRLYYPNHGIYTDIVNPTLDEFKDAVSNLGVSNNSGVTLYLSKSILQVSVAENGERFLVRYYETDLSSSLNNPHCLIDLYLEDSNYDDHDSIIFIAPNGEMHRAGLYETVSKDVAIEAAVYIFTHEALPPNSKWVEYLY